MANKEYKFEKVSHEPSHLNNGEFIPQVNIVSNNENVEENYREFQAGDILRVLDGKNMPAPPDDAVFGHLEFEMDDDDTITDDAPPKFPNRYFVLRGGYIFYFSLDNVEGLDVPDGANSKQGRYYHQNTTPKINGPPLGVIPLERTVVEFPPGGRRCFREHSKTNARNGYEMMIRHKGRGGVATADGSGAVKTKRRAPAYIVADTNAQRELWKKAIVSRADDAHRQDTVLRPTGVTNISDPTADTTGVAQNGRKSKGRGSPSRSDLLLPERRIGGNISVLAGVLEPGEQEHIDEALEQFGNSAFFEAADWANQFFEQNDEFESLTTSRKLESWQTSIKKGLRGAVLEQYEYFVEASKGMTIMGKEIATLKELVAKQVETVESMRNVNFELGSLAPNKNIESGANNLEFPDDEDELYSSDDDDDDENNPVNQHDNGTGKVVTNNAWGDFEGKRKKKNSSASAIEVPVWLDDVVEEISAYIKECRYSDATDLLLRAKNEINEIMNQHDKLTEKKLPKKQFATMQRILRSIDNLTTRMCEHLSEGLRRKNDALRHIQKKERNDPLLANAPLVSPIALNDDASALCLLVKLGRPLDAATAYSTRRSLLLSECLHERSICHSSHSVDVVIYAAQLSHSFFNSLAMSIEGFLDLFSETDKNHISDDHSEASSIYTGSLKTVPANALAATCLWCDSETSKFAAAFGTKVLGHLNLYPRLGSAITDKITQFEVANDLTHDKKQLQVAVEMGEFEIAEKLRKKITLQEQEEKSGKTNVPKSAEKDRLVAIEIAAKCIDQAFDFATDCLNSIGLPLTPRLAEYIRPRLKGTEAEIATELGTKWESITFNWKESENRSIE